MINTTFNIYLLICAAVRSIFTYFNMILYVLSVIAIILYVLHLLLNCNKTAQQVKKISGPKDVFLFGNGLEILVSPVELFKLGRKYASKFRGIYRFYAYPIVSVNIYNPEDIEIVTASLKHSEKSPLYKFLKPWLQEGLLLSNGLKWQQRRKILTPAFHFDILRQFCVILEENGQRLVETLHETRGETIDIQPVISEYTLSSICETAMGTRLHEVTSEGAGKMYKDSIYELGKIVVDRFINVYFFWDFIFNFSSNAKKQKTCLKVLHDFTDRVIEERKQNIEHKGANFFDETKKQTDDTFMFSKKKRAAMLDLLILAHNDGKLDRNGIQEEVDTFMFEGHDTTASGLTFNLLLLALYKNAQDRVVAELQEIFGNSGRMATIEDLNKMKYLDCCIKESLRLYPPVHFISRRLSETEVLSNYTVPAGTICNIHIYDLHRREDLFKNALVFDPDRFLPENCVGRHPYSYIPFSAGPRNCIGQKFAVLEMKSCISAILRNFELVPVTTEVEIQCPSDLVLRNSAPVYMKFVPKNK